MRFMRMVVALSVVVLWCFSIEASDRKSKRRYQSESAVAVAKAQTATTQSETPQKVEKGSDDALAEVNEYRAKRGLPPFQHDPLLTQAALKAATLRASRGIHGHLESDFACLPPGASADAAGCGALEDSWGWGTCCTEDNYSHAGAAWVRGADGRRYMHLFVRNQGNAPLSKPVATETITPANQVVTSSGGCTGGSCGVTTRYTRRGR